jgi:hypothetical protein
MKLSYESWLSNIKDKAIAEIGSTKKNMSIPLIL